MNINTEVLVGIAESTLFRKSRKVKELEYKLRQIQIMEFSDLEKSLILAALDEIKGKIQDPQTKWFTRNVYKNLRSKIKASMK